MDREQAKTKYDDILRVGNDGIETESVEVGVEASIRIDLNGAELVTLLCTPTDLDELAVGYLFSEGLISSFGDIETLQQSPEPGTLSVGTKSGKASPKPDMGRRAIASSGWRGRILYDADAMKQAAIRVKSRFTPERIMNLMEEFDERAELYRSTRLAHSAALGHERGIEIYIQDIGRHNAIDKVVGRALITGVDMEHKVLISSGRLTSDTVLKAVKGGFGVVCSGSAPSNMGIELARKLGITLIGGFRDQAFRVYANPERLAGTGAGT